MVKTIVKIVKKTAFFFLKAVFSISWINVSGQWIETNGPGVGVRSLLQFDNKLYAGTDGGVFMTPDYGDTWISLDNGLPSYDGIWSLAVKGNTIFAGTVVGGNDTAEIYFSVDSGSSWASCSVGLNMTTGITAFAIKDSFLFAAGDGLSKSTDNGLSWTKCLTNSVYSIIFKENILFAGTYNDGIFRSFDYGQTWDTVNFGLPNFPVNCFGIKNGRIFAGLNWGIYMSDDNGTTWLQSFPSYITHDILANDSCLLVACEGLILRSFDDGITWLYAGFFGASSLEMISNNIFAGSYPNVFRSQLDSLTAIFNIYKSVELNLFPNPFFTQTTVQTDNLFCNATLMVDNYIGQTVKQIKNISGQTFILQRDNLPTGFYFVRLTQDNKVIATKKIVIAD